MNSRRRIGHPSSQPISAEDAGEQCACARLIRRVGAHRVPRGGRFWPPTDDYIDESSCFAATQSAQPIQCHQVVLVVGLVEASTLSALSGRKTMRTLNQPTKAGHVLLSSCYSE